MTAPSLRDAATQDRTGEPVDWLHVTIVIVVFGITGTLSVLFSKLLLEDMLHLDGEVWSGPWSYRVAYLLLIPPFYSVTLMMVGTLLGKHSYFKKRVFRMWDLLLLRRIHRRSAVSASAPPLVTDDGPRRRWLWTRRPANAGPPVNTVPNRTLQARRRDMER